MKKSASIPIRWVQNKALETIGDIRDTSFTATILNPGQEDGQIRSLI